MKQSDVNERRTAIHLLRIGRAPAEVAAELQRSLAWVYKWRKRFFEDENWDDLQDRSRAPKRCPNKLPEEVRQAICQARSELEAEATEPGKLVFLHGNDRDGAESVTGRTETERWRWNHVVFVRDGERVRVYLNGNSQPEIDTESPAGFPAGLDQLFFGGRSDNQANWEGRLDEIAVFTRALSAAEVEALSVR